VFINHSQPELQASQKASGQWSAAYEFQSKVNMYEVGMSVAVVRYLLQQGYQPSQLVLLTPYLGQLLELQRELTNQNMQALLAELDVWDLKKAALPAALSGISGGGGSGKAGRLQDSRQVYGLRPSTTTKEKNLMWWWPHWSAATAKAASGS